MNLITPTALQLFAQEHHGELLKQAAGGQQALQEPSSFISSLLRLLHVRLPSPLRPRPLNP